MTHNDVTYINPWSGETVSERLTPERAEGIIHMMSPEEREALHRFDAETETETEIVAHFLNQLADERLSALMVS